MQYAVPFVAQLKKYGYFFFSPDQSSFYNILVQWPTHSEAMRLPYIAAPHISTAYTPEKAS